MKKHKLLLQFTFLLILVILSSCSSDKSTILFYLGELNLTLEDEFEIKKCESSGLNDFLYEIEIVLSENDSERIVNQIKSLKNYTNNFSEVEWKETINKPFELAFFKENYFYVSKYQPNKSAYSRQSLFFYPETKILKYNYFEE